MKFAISRRNTEVNPAPNAACQARRIEYPSSMLRTLGLTLGLALFLLESAQAEGTDTLAQGKQLAFAADKGNCLACHVMDDAETGGNLGPPLLYMSARYPELDTLVEFISDARTENPDSAMPPYGAHHILNHRELQAIAEYVHSL